MINSIFHQADITLNGGEYYRQKNTSIHTFTTVHKSNWEKGSERFSSTWYMTDAVPCLNVSEQLEFRLLHSSFENKSKGLVLWNVYWFK